MSHRDQRTKRGIRWVARPRLALLILLIGVAGETGAVGDGQVPGSGCSYCCQAFANAVIEVRDETPLLVDDMLSDSGLFAELSTALPAMLYEFLKDKKP